MARPINKLSATKCESKTLKVGRHSDGGGLYLSVSKAGTKSWVFIYVQEKHDRFGVRRAKVEMGLGSYPTVSLALARERAAAYRTAVAEGHNPKSLRDKASEPTFGECAEAFISSMENGWRNAKHRAQWRSTLETYCASVWNTRVSSVGTEEVLAILNPIWLTKAETAQRVRGRIERVLDYAAARGWRHGPNVAIWRGHLRALLPKPEKLKRGHHASMPYKDVPALIQRLQKLSAMSARGLEFLILTAARTGEVIGATWAEFDLEAGIWTVPAERMKAGREHRVPLPARATEIVKTLHDARTSDYVFPGEKPKTPLSSMAFAMLLRRMELDDFTPHGFRSSFRDWCGDETHFPREIAEAALAHKIPNQTEAAYRRSDALAKRRTLMESWARYCLDYEPKKVVRLHAHR